MSGFDNPRVKITEGGPGEGLTSFDPLSLKIMRSCLQNTCFLRNYLLNAYALLIRNLGEVSSMLLDRFFALKLSERKWLCDFIVNVELSCISISGCRCPFLFSGFLSYCLTNNKYTVDSRKGFKLTRNQ